MRKRYYNPRVGMSTRWSRHKAQAKYRGEAYELTLEQYSMLWSTQGLRSRDQFTGRRGDSISMVRKDPRQPWRVDNIHFLTRAEYTQSFRRRYAELGYMKERYVKPDR